MALAKPLLPSYVFNYCLQLVKALLALEGRGILHFSGAAVGRDGSENCETQPSIQPVFVEPLLCALGWDGGKIYRSAFRFTLELGSSVHPLTCLCCFGGTLPTEFPFDPLLHRGTYDTCLIALLCVLSQISIGMVCCTICDS